MRSPKSDKILGFQIAEIEVLLRIKGNSDIRLKVKGRTDSLGHFDLG